MVHSPNIPEDVVNAYRICEFISCCRQLLPFIEESLRTSDGERSLPPTIASFISYRLSISVMDVSELWSAHMDVVSSKEIGRFDHLGSRIDATTEDILRLQTLSLRESLLKSFKRI